MRAVIVLIAVVVLALLGAVGWYAYSALAAPGEEPIAEETLITLFAGAISGLIVGVGLLAFYSGDPQR